MKKITILIAIIVLLSITTTVVILNKRGAEPAEPIQVNPSGEPQVIETPEEPEVPEEPEEPTEIDMSSIDDLDFSFMKLENNGENMIYSPLSIKTALLMLRDGATGETKAQIDELLGDYKGKSYPSSKNISFANSVFIRDTFKQYVKDSYGSNLKSKYGAEVFIDDFSSAEKANNWITEKTLGLIKNVLRDDQVQNPLTVMLLINALGIDMEWKEKFDEQFTSSGYFLKENDKYLRNDWDRYDNIRDDDCYYVPMMYEQCFINTYEPGTKYYDDWDPSSELQYYVDDNITVYAKGLKEYEGVNLQFIAIQPEKTPLQEFVKSFDSEKYKEVLSSLKKIDRASHNPNKYIEIYFKLPKFKFDYGLKLKEDLKKLGMLDAFENGKAEFYNIIEKDGPAFLYVGDAIHKANIDLSEEGIKAAAVTIFMMEGGGEGDEEIEWEYIHVYIDKPFLFIIRDVDTGDIWFTGTVYKPTLWDEVASQYEPMSWDEYEKLMND